MCVVVVLYFYKERKVIEIGWKKYKSRIVFDKKSECEDCFGLW